MTLNVMLLESDHGVGEEAANELAEAGHAVLRCHDPDAPAFPCRGLVDAASCPLHSHAVDVALTVRSQVASQPAPSEDGARCALMSGVPLVVAGPSVFDPYVGLEVSVLDRTYDVVAACEDAVTTQLADRARRVETVIAPSFRAHGASIPTVSVTRSDGAIRVRVSGLGSSTREQRQFAVVRALGAMRQIDRSARTIDIAFDDE
jgi:hypothetical protein